MVKHDDSGDGSDDYLHHHKSLGDEDDVHPVKLMMDAGDDSM